MFKLISAAILAIALNCVYLVAANSADRYGAIAYSPRTGSVGWSYDYDTRRGAERRAQNGCREHARDCRVAIWTKNACAALAVGRNGGWASYWHTNKAKAKSRAIRACRKRDKGCKVKRWICT